MNWNEIYFVGDLISPNIYRYATATMWINRATIVKEYAEYKKKLVK